MRLEQSRTLQPIAVSLGFTTARSAVVKVSTLRLKQSRTLQPIAVSLGFTTARSAVVKVNTFIHFIVDMGKT